jgi:hypothetical protein
VACCIDATMQMDQILFRVQSEHHYDFAGLGADHAKWSPVATAWYRLDPEVVLLKVCQLLSE